MFARTPRLTLRPGWPEDAPALAAAIGHKAVAARLAHVPWPYHRRDAEAFLAMPHRSTDAHLLIHAHEGDGPELVGGIALVADGAAHELGYWLSPSAWNRGYATEAGRAMIDIARHALPIRHLTAYPHLDNAASAGVLRKLGFVQTGRAIRHSRARGAQVDSAVYELDLEADPGLALAA